jgi:hypothetical protein
LLGVVLIVTGLLANLPLLGFSFLIQQTWPAEQLPELARPAVMIVAALLDWRLIAMGVPKPPAVRSQVPQWWGHRYGPWVGSVRYGLRLGLGPATMLNSWLWWAGLIVLSSMPWALAIGATSFVLVRTLTTLSVSWGVTSGSAMATRAQTLDSMERPIRYGVVVSLVLATALSLL